MSKSRLVLRSFIWTVVLTSLFVLTLGAVLIAFVVGDWIFLKTGNDSLAWFLGISVMLGFLATLGGGIGFWLWTRSPNIVRTRVTDPTEEIDIILADMVERD